MYFTSTLADGVATSNDRIATAITTYPSGAIVTVTSYPNRFYSSSLDGFLSNTEFAAGASDTNIRIKSAQINGSNLEVVIENTNVSNTYTFSGELEWRVWKA